MNPIETVSATQAYEEPCADHVAMFTQESRTIIVVADGACWTGGAHATASSVIHEVETGYLQESQDQMDQRPRQRTRSPSRPIPTGSGMTGNSLASESMMYTYPINPSKNSAENSTRTTERI
jgi:hypothetical protein